MIACRKRLAFIERETERRDVGAESIVGLDGFGYQVRTLAFFSWIFILAKVGIRPAVKRAVPDTSKIIGYQFVSQHVAFVDHGP